MNRTNLIAALLGVAGTTAAIAAQAQTTHVLPATPPAATAAPSASAINALAPEAAAASIESCVAKTDALLAALDKGDYAGAEMDFTPTMRAGLPPDQLQRNWESLSTRFGTPGPRGAPHNSLSGGYVVITVPMPFPGTMLAAQVACAADGHIGGFHVMMLQAPAPAASSGAAPASASS